MVDDDYKFLQIRDAITSINQKVNLIGVIFEIGFPKQTKGTDCFCTLKIIDESRSKPGISVNFFAESMEMLPHVASAGDIIQLSHVVVHPSWNGGEDCLPYQVSSKFRPRDLDKTFIKGLRKWLVDFQLDEGLTKFLFLREIKQEERVNLICKIVHICEVAKDEWMAFLWDGTDAPPISLPTKLDDEMNNPAPLQLEPVPLPGDVLCTFPTIGTILRVIFDQGMQKHLLRFLHTGKWVKFVNILCEVHSGLWRGVFTPFTKLQYTPNEDHLVSAWQRLYNERLSLKWGRIPYSSFPWPSNITVVDYDNVPFVTLRDVLSYSKVTAKFKCVARVVAAFPWQAEDFLSPLGTYRIRLTLEDPTARIHAFLYGEDGEKFFGGYPSVDALTQKLNKLLGLTVSDNGKQMNNSPRNPPWVQFCLKSYYLSKTEVWGSRHYRIFDTKVVE
ncbi:protection of telomeres protein 1b-like isoform X2 [Quercus robur]|uniref:protection of telomeres protein 1b-like isoform X2 n=1 Tax=Quercus robur TaxID=38942 RepID=UPI002161FB86|nr:protection of telomeres protein 1b-like isoform X2 [Quercus robur]